MQIERERMGGEGCTEGREGCTLPGRKRNLTRNRKK